MKKQLLKERFQKLANIAPIHVDDDDDEWIEA